MFKGKTKNGVDISETYGFNAPLPGMTWILVASRSGAKLFENKGPNEPLEFPREFPFPQGKIMDKEIYQDQPGRSFNSTSQSHGGHGTSSPRHSFSSEVTPHELSAHKFAKTLAAMLEKGRNNHRFSKLVLVAEPRFMGVLKGELSTEVAKQITHTLEKDVEEMPNHLLEKYVLDSLKI